MRPEHATSPRTFYPNVGFLPLRRIGAQFRCSKPAGRIRSCGSITEVPAQCTTPGIRPRRGIRRPACTRARSEIFLGASLENRAPGIPPGSRVPGDSFRPPCQGSATPRKPVLPPIPPPRGRESECVAGCTIRRLQGSRISQPRKTCPRSESNRHAFKGGGFSCHFGFRRPGHRRHPGSWSGARLHHSHRRP